MTPVINHKKDNISEAVRQSEIIMLGTGNAMCTRCYNTCFVVRTPAGGMMVDAGGGNGIFRQLYRARIAVESIHHLVVTHAHTDHIMGVIWMIRRISPMMHNGHYQGVFTIYCHDEVAQALRTMCALMMPQKIYSALDNTIIIQVVEHNQRVAVDDMEVTFFDIGSTKTKQFGFQAILPDGQRLTCLGDEPYQPQSEPYVRGCDWLMCEAFCLYRDRLKFKPYEKHHSTALEAGKLAQELGVKHLLLYHTEDTRLMDRRLTYSTEAAQHFTGPIYVPDDLETVKLTPLGTS